MIREINEDKLEMWYLNFYASRHICNSCERFIDLYLKSYKFVIARDTIIKSIQVETIIFLFENI